MCPILGHWHDILTEISYWLEQWIFCVKYLQILTNRSVQYGRWPRWWSLWCHKIWQKLKLNIEQTGVTTRHFTHEFSGYLSFSLIKTEVVTTVCCNFFRPSNHIPYMGICSCYFRVLSISFSKLTTLEYIGLLKMN